MTFERERDANVVVSNSISDVDTYLCTEYVTGGSLDNFLKQNDKTISPKTRVEMAVTATRGMQYLVQQGIIHRDLAARNILVEPLQDKYILKGILSIYLPIDLYLSIYLISSFNI